MGNNLQSTQEEEISSPQQRMLQETVGVCEFERNLQVSRKVWSGQEVDRQVISGGLMLSEKEMKLLWREYDLDGDGMIETEQAKRFLKDLLVVLEKREIQNSKNEIAALKLKKDMYRRNGWNYEKAVTYAKTLNKHLPAIFIKFQFNLNQFMIDLDTDRDGLIKYDDFLEFCKRFNVNEQRKKLYGPLPCEVDQ